MYQIELQQVTALSGIDVQSWSKRFVCRSAVRSLAATAIRSVCTAMISQALFDLLSGRGTPKQTHALATHQTEVTLAAKAPEIYLSEVRSSTNGHRDRPRYCRHFEARKAYRYALLLRGLGRRSRETELVNVPNGATETSEPLAFGPRAPKLSCQLAKRRVRFIDCCGLR